MKKILNILLVSMLTLIMFGCGSKTEEVDMPEVTQLLSSGGVNLDYATYKVSESKKDKNIKVTAAYNDEIMIVGKIVGIRNIIESNFSNDYSKIELTIIQQNPKFSSVNYVFKDGSWDKDVE